jgi:hypothetical protein
MTYEHDHAQGVISRHQYQPGNGTNYVCYVSTLPGDYDGGNAEQYALVTLYWPWRDAYVLRWGGHLTKDYVAEKFGRNHAPDDPDIVAIHELLCRALNRE